jgi:hypothetical protein
MSKQTVAFDPKIQSIVPLAPIGQVHIDEFGRRFLYGRADGALTAGRMHHMATDASYDFTPNTTTLTGTPGTHWKLLGVPDIDMTDNYYGWFWIGYGTFECVIENNFAAADVIYTTASAGLPGTNSSSHILDGFKTIDAGVTSTRVTCWAAGRLSAGVSMCSD